MADESTGRRLPVYLVLDTSGSMSGAAIEAVRQGVRALMSDLKSDPMALETAYVSVITFSSTAQQLCPLTDLLSFQEPTLEATGSTALGAALRLLSQSVDKEVRRSTATQKGDWKPLVFLMTDGQPTDSWEAVADEIKAKGLNIIALAAGSGADETALKRVTEMVIKTQDLAPDTLKQFFKWVTSSIKTSSSSVASGGGQPMNLPPPPQAGGFVIVP